MVEINGAAKWPVFAVLLVTSTISDVAPAPNLITELKTFRPRTDIVVVPARAG